jgi:hypothetical protein
MQTVFLYLDPGTGSMLLQAMIAGVLAFTMFMKNIKFHLMALWTAHFGSSKLVQKLKQQYAALYTKYTVFRKSVLLVKTVKVKLTSLF